jgi:hypothetical protein
LPFKYDHTAKRSIFKGLDPKQVQFELHISNGRADYLLRDKIGRVLYVLEAKREDLDPYDAKEQTRGYAENLSAPFIILSNGREHWFWNYERANQRDAYRIERLPSRSDLERVRLKNLQPPRPLQSEVIAPEYLRALKHDLTLRRYQIQAMDEIAKLFDREERRKFLLEMATDQIIGDDVDEEIARHAMNAAMFGPAHGSVLLAPTEDAFDHLAALLRHGIAFMPRRAAVDGARCLPAFVTHSFCATCGVTLATRSAAM